jgi:8-amino-7-oxononanoate synthase
VIDIFIQMEFKKILNEIKSKGLYREFRTIESPCSNIVRYKNRDYIMLASNNYYGLNTHPKVIQAAKGALEKYGSGSAASRLIANSEVHEMLERELAQYKKTESALAYSSGYAANIGAISSLVGKNDLILSDELNHASIIDGCRLSKAEVVIYKHNNIADLKHKLSKSLRKSKYEKTLIVTESIFSMDGDLAPLLGIIELKKDYDFLFMVDDAHSTGIIDTNLDGVDIHMGTLSKALASQGGFISGSSELIDYLRNTSRSFMFSTGLSPANASSALAALRIIRKNKKMRAELLKNAFYMRQGLQDIGFDILGAYQIIPIIMKDIGRAMKFQKLLEKEGIFVAGIRPPTVKTSRLRVSVMSTHTKEQLDKSLKAFEKVKRILV